MYTDIKIYPVISRRSGLAVNHQYFIALDEGVAFQSYDSLIAFYNMSENRLTLGRDWNYSVTTSKYLHQFFLEYCPRLWYEINTGRSMKDSIQKAIDAGLIDYDPEMK